MGKNARFSGTRHGKQFWVEEKQNFGAKVRGFYICVYKRALCIQYLARMGWKPGEGLGDSGSGLKKCIGIVRKNDSVGNRLLFRFRPEFQTQFVKTVNRSQLSVRK